MADDAGILFDIENRLLNEIEGFRNDFPDRAEQLMGDASDGIAEIIRGAMVDEAPYKWGDLREGHTVEDIGPLEKYIFSDVPHFEWIVKGTKPHDIYPIGTVSYLGQTIRQGKRALFWEGASHPVPMVHHPGTEPNDYPARALINAEGDIEARLDQFLQELIGGG